MRQIDDDTISIEWTTDDIKERLQERFDEDKLTTDECRSILKMMLDKHDSLIGINMDVMDVLINRAIEERESDANHKSTN